MSQKFGSFQGTGNTKYLNYNGSVTSGDIWFDHSNSAIKIYNGTSWDEVGLAFVGIDDNATSTAITIDSNERVGIGMSANSGCLLNVNDHIRAENSAFLAGRETAALPAFAFHDDTDTGMFNVASNILAFSTAGTERMRITSAGNIEVSGDFSSTVSGYDGNGDLSTNIGATISATTSGTLINNFFTADLIFSTNGGNSTATERMRIDSSGNVGIGTVSPSIYGKTALVQTTNASTGGLAIVDSTSAQSAKLWCDTTNAYLSSGNTGADPLILNAGGGNVGISKSSPQYALDVEGNIRATNSGGSSIIANRTSNPGSVELQYNGTQTAQFSAVSGGGIATYVGSSPAEAMRIDSSGNVGIGTASPSRTLDIQGSSSTNIPLVVRSGSGQTNGFIAINDPNTTSEFNNRIGSVGNNMVFHTSGVEKVRIDASGNVGIGTTSPDQTLHVHKGSAGSVSSHSASVLTLENSTTGVLQFLTPNTNAQQIRFGDPQDNGAGLIQYDHATSVMQFNVNGPERMRIDNSGNVGIGTSSPWSDAKLTIDNGGSGSVSMALSRSGSGQNDVALVNDAGQFIVKSGAASTVAGLTDQMRISDVGNVYFGTTDNWFTASGRKILRVHGAGGGSFLVLDTSGSGDFYIGSENNGLVNFWNQANADLVFGTNNTERMRIDSAGRVCIGTTSGTELMNVAATSGNGAGVEYAGNGNTVGSGSFFVGQGSGSEAYVYQRANSHMIFATNNTERMRLEADGDLHVDGDVIAYSTTISDQRLKGNVETIKDALNKVTDLRGVTYTWNAGSRTGKSDMGVIAQEVESIIPEIVHDKEMALMDGETYKTVDYEKLTALLIEAVKELKAEVDNLKASQ